jgi:hypothetical protein
LTADLLRPGASLAVSFLLSGPPGAGKSAWVRHLAARTGLPVLHKRASDLLDPFVGGTEQNIAGAFAEARDTRLSARFLRLPLWLFFIFGRWIFADCGAPSALRNRRLALSFIHLRRATIFNPPVTIFLIRMKS